MLVHPQNTVPLAIILHVLTHKKESYHCCIPHSPVTFSNKSLSLAWVCFIGALSLCRNQELVEMNLYSVTLQATLVILLTTSAALAWRIDCRWESNISAWHAPEVLPITILPRSAPLCNKLPLQLIVSIANPCNLAGYGAIFSNKLGHNCSAVIHGAIVLSCQAYAPRNVRSRYLMQISDLLQVRAHWTDSFNHGNNQPHCCRVDIISSMCLMALPHLINSCSAWDDYPLRGITCIACISLSLLTTTAFDVHEGCPLEIKWFYY